MRLMMTVAIPLFAFVAIAMIGLGIGFAVSNDDDPPVRADQKRVCAHATPGTVVLVADGKCRPVQ